MAPRSKITQLPNDAKQWLDQALIDGNFSAYQALVAALKEIGYSISKSAIHRYGKTIEDKMAAIKASTEAAKMIAEGLQDDEDSRSGAVIAMVQSEIFNALLALEASNQSANPEERLKTLASAAKSIADITRASISNKKYAADIKAKVEAKFNELEQRNSKSQGFDTEMFKRIKQEVYGLF